MLVTSELVTNATLHAGTECEVELRGTPGALVIRVSDFDKQVDLKRKSFGAEMTTGRGLRMLEVLCRRWGPVEPVRPVRGKTARVVRAPRPRLTNLQAMYRGRCVVPWLNGSTSGSHAVGRTTFDPGRPPPAK